MPAVCTSQLEWLDYNSHLCKMSNCSFSLPWWQMRRCCQGQCPLTVFVLLSLRWRNKAGRVEDFLCILQPILPVSMTVIYACWRAMHTHTHTHAVPLMCWPLKPYLKNPFFSVSLFEGLIPSWVTCGHNGEASVGRGTAHTLLMLCLSFGGKKSTFLNRS